MLVFFIYVCLQAKLCYESFICQVRPEQPVKDEGLLADLAGPHLRPPQGPGKEEGSGGEPGC